MPVELAQTDEGAVMVESGIALIGTDLFWEPPLEQPLAVTVQFRTTLPLAPAVKVIELPVLDPGMEPPVIVQA